MAYLLPTAVKPYRVEQKFGGWIVWDANYDIVSRTDNGDGFILTSQEVQALTSYPVEPDPVIEEEDTTHG